jgi:hypothetical protein
MYMGSNGATFVYASYLTVVCVYIKNVEFWLWNQQNGGFECAEGKGRPSKQDAWSVVKIAIRDAP